MTAGLPGVAAADGPLAGTSWPVILAGRRGRLLIGMSLTELVVAVQLLIVITVMPAVVRQLGGIRLYGLALSVAAIAGIGAAPLAVRLLDAPHRLLATGGALILAGIGGTAIGLLPGAWLAPYLAWAVGGFGMGLAYAGSWLAVMAAQQAEGGAATGLAGPLVADRMSTALGAGVGGVCIALATGAGLSVGSGIGLGLGIAVAGGVGLAVAARRMA